jgi:hypothetical protein
MGNGATTLKWVLGLDESFKVLVLCFHDLDKHGDVVFKLHHEIY